MVGTVFLASSFLPCLAETKAAGCVPFATKPLPLLPPPPFNSRAVHPGGMLSISPPFRNLQGFRLFHYNCPALKSPRSTPLLPFRRLPGLQTRRHSDLFHQRSPSH